MTTTISISDDLAARLTELATHSQTTIDQICTTILANHLEHIDSDMEAELQRANQKIKNILASIDDAFFSLDYQWRFTYISRRAEQLLRKPAEKLLGKGIWDEFPEAIGSNFYKNYHRASAEGVTLNFEEFYPPFDVWFEVNVYPFEDGISVYFKDITSRKSAEVQLKKQEEFLRSIYTGTPMGIFVVDVTKELEFRLVGCNPAAEKVVGFTNDEICGKTPPEIFGPVLGGAIIQNYRNCLAKETAISYEECFQVSGKQVWSLTTLSPLKDDSGRIYRIIGASLDISDRKLTEQSLEIFKRAVEESSDAIGIADAQGNHYYQNRAFDKLYECNSPEEFNQAGGIAAVFQDPAVPKEVLTAITAGQTWIGEVEQFSCKGRPMTTILRAYPIKDSQGNIISVVGATTDITEAKKAEALLLQQSQREKLLNKLTSQIRNSLDFQQIINVALEEIRNYLQIERVAFCYFHPSPEPTWQVIHESKIASAKSIVGSYAANAEGPWASRLLNLEILQIDNADLVEQPELQKLSQDFAAKAMLYLPTRSQSGQISILMCSNHSQARVWRSLEIDLLQDVLEQLTIALNQAELYQQSNERARQLEETLQELQRTQTQMIQSEKMSSLGQLVAGVAHEINNPVSFIYGNLIHAEEYVDDLLELIQAYKYHYPRPVAEIQDKQDEIDLEFLAEDLPKLLDSMKTGADRITQIVLSLRTFSRMDEADMKAVDIHDGIDSTLMILQNRLKSQSIKVDGIDYPRAEIVISKDYGNLPAVECYAGQLNQVFMNLLVNAIDALEDKIRANVGDQAFQPEIKIHTRLLVNTPPMVLIVIQDNGPGIPEDIQKQVFDPFFTTKPIGKGTGMGLAISHQIITERHLGQMECNSQLGVGTEFRIMIPINQESKEG